MTSGESVSLEMATSLVLFGDLMSQSCRSVSIFLRANSIPHSERRTVLCKGSSVEEHGRVNLLHVVPMIDDAGFVLTEGDAILKYLCGRYDVAENWYPVDLQLRARVDEVCTWNNMNVHASSYGVYSQQVLEPKIKNIPVNRDRLRRHQLELDRGLDRMEQVLLEHSDFVCGDDITIADLLVACELMQAVCAGHEIKAMRPKLAEWFDRVEKRLQPHFHEAHVVLRETKGLDHSMYHFSSFDS